MAAVAAEILLLLLLLTLNMVRADIVQGAGGSHRFILDPTADFCVISRYRAEVETLLWNSSRPLSSGVEREASYRINLTVSDSGRYQEKCWTGGNVTLERNSSILVCDDLLMRDHKVTLVVGETVELECNVRSAFRWFLEHEKTLISINETSSANRHSLVPNSSSLLVRADKPGDGFVYVCAEMNRRTACDLIGRYHVDVVSDFLYRSVGEGVELRCSDVGGNRTHVWRMFNHVKDGGESHDDKDGGESHDDKDGGESHDDKDGGESHDDTLSLPSLTHEHTGHYTCEGDDDVINRFYLLVCPEPGPPAVALVSPGDNLHVGCYTWNHWDKRHWLKKVNTKVVNLNTRLEKIVGADTSLTLMNMTLDDGGVFLCAVMEGGRCASTYETHLVFEEPGPDHHLVRSVLLGSVIVMMCAVVVATVCWSRRGERRPVPVEEVEMSTI